MSRYVTDFAKVIHTKAEIVPLEIPGTYNYENPSIPFRFRGIVDDYGNQLAAVSDQYALVQNVDVARAVKDALFDEGITNIKMGGAMYRNGRTRFSLKLPDQTFTVPGDPSNVMPLLTVGNDYGGGGSVVGEAGLFRAYCTNGMKSVHRTMTVRLPHRGQLDYDVIYKEVRPMVATLLADSAKTREVAELLASLPAPMTWVDKLIEDTGKRYDRKLHDSIQSNITNLGDTAWAVAQGITEHSTHDRTVGWATDTWAKQAIAGLLAEVQLQEVK